MTFTMDRLTSGAAYSTSAGLVSNGILTWLSPDEWSAFGVLTGFALALLTLMINWFYKRKVALAQIEALHHKSCDKDPREE